MSILIGGTNETNPPIMKELIVGSGASGDSSEKYRLVVGDQYRSTLVYAKGWINFNPNPIKDGSGNIIDYYGQLNNNEYWMNLYAFYDDGFYAYSSSNWLKVGSTLAGTNTLFSAAAIFNGWYTEPSGGNKIESIEDVYRYTELFNHKNSTSIPEITLYAHWTIKQMTVYVHNITRYNSNNENETATSSFIYNGYRTRMTTTLQVPYNTELIGYLNKKIKSPQYITWARYKLDGTPLQQALRNGVQNFTGWYTSSDGNGTVWTNYYVTNTTNVYPQFLALVVWPRETFFNRGYTGSGCYVHVAPFTLEEAKNGEPDADGGGYSGYWSYTDSYFPLGSSATYVAGWRQS